MVSPCWPGLSASPSPRLSRTAIVEQVRDGTQLRVRLLLDDEHHQFINLVSRSTEWTGGQEIDETGGRGSQEPEGRRS